MWARQGRWFVVVATVMAAAGLLTFTSLHQLLRWAGECSTGYGSAARLVVQFAISQADPGCQIGAVTFGGQGTVVLDIAILITLPALCALLIAALASLRLGRALRAVVAIARTILTRIARFICSPATPRVATAPPTGTPPPTAFAPAPLLRSLLRRGPPAVSFA